MTRRMAAVLALSADEASAPPGIDAPAFARAMVEDIADLIDSLEQCECAVVTSSSYADELRPLLSRDTAVLTIEPGDTAATTLAAFGALHEAGASVAVLVACDAPDLPGLLVGKLFSALTEADVAICPGQEALVALAARLPAPQWLGAAGVGLDSPDAHGRLAGSAPRADALVVTSGWHRLRSPADIAALDYGLEGWEATRALLGGY